jgi:peptidoglycan-associated lipoprotein
MFAAERREDMTSIRSLVLALAASSLAACAHRKASPPVETQPPMAAPALAPVQAAPSRPVEATAPVEPAVAAPAPAAVEIPPVSVYFPFDSAELSDETRTALQTFFEQAQQRSDAEVRIEGNCDERGTAEYNLALGQRRAEAARKYLSDLGLDRSRITAVSYGEERPRALGDDEAAWRENRRDDLVTTGAGASRASR